MVTGLAQDEHGVVVRGGDEKVDAQAVVVTAGAWAKSLLSSANITLDVWPTRETVGFLISILQRRPSSNGVIRPFTHCPAETGPSKPPNTSPGLRAIPTKKEPSTQHP